MIIIINKVELTISYLNLSSVDSSWISKILYLTILSLILFKIIILDNAVHLMKVQRGNGENSVKLTIVFIAIRFLFDLNL